METILKSRVFVFLFALPLYVFIMIGERYESLGASWHHPFSWRGQSGEFWGEWLGHLLHNKSLHQKGRDFNKQMCVKKVRRRARKHLVKMNVNPEATEMFDTLTALCRGTGLWLRQDNHSTDAPRFLINDAYRNLWNDERFSFTFVDNEWRFTKYDSHGWRQFTLDADAAIDDVYSSKGKYTQKAVTLDEMTDVLERFSKGYINGWRA